MALLSKLLLLLAALPAFASPSRRSSLPDGPERHGTRQVASADIIGGTNSDVTEFPYIVAINRDYQWCGGILLNAHTVISAAHCYTDDMEYSSFSIRLGTSIWWKGGVTVNVTEVIRYPGYNDTTYQNDLSLWRLSRPVYQSSTIRYAVLPNQDFYPTEDTPVKVAGWGATANKNGSAPNLSPDILQKITVPVISRAGCKASFTRFGQPDLSFAVAAFCAGPKEGGGHDSCEGDSGGPVVDPNGVVIGVNSDGAANRCAVPGAYTAYTNLGHFINWINQNRF